MLFNFINWIFSWWRAPQLLLTEDPLTYLASKLESDGNEIMYIRKGVLYYGIVPPAYNACIKVDYNMSDIIIDNNIANVRSLVYDGIRPVWPTFTGSQPTERWTTPFLLYFVELS
jgi:hypothetical protein